MTRRELQGSFGLMKSEKKSYIKIEKKGNAEYAYRMFHYYDRETKNTKYNTKEYLGKVIGYKADGTAIYKKVRGSIKNRSSEQALIKVNKILEQDIYFRRLERKYSKSKVRPLSLLLHGLLFDHKELATSVSFQSFSEVLSMLVETEYPARDTKPVQSLRRKLAFIITCPIRFKATVEDSSFELLFDPSSPKQRKEITIAQTIYIPVVDGSAGLPTVQWSALINAYSLAEESIVRVYPIQGVSRDLLDKACANHLSFLIAYDKKQKELLSDIGFEYKPDEGQERSRETSYEIDSRFGKVFGKGPDTDGSVAGFVTNIDREKASVAKVADMTIMMEKLIQEMIGGLKGFLEEIQIQRLDKQLLEEAIPVLTYFAFILKNDWE